MDGEGGELLGLEVQVAGVGTEELSVQGDDVDFTTVLLGDGAEVLSELLTLLSGLGEDVGQGKAGLRIVSKGLSVMIVNVVGCLQPCTWSRSQDQAHQPGECWRS